MGDSITAGFAMNSRPEDWDLEVMNKGEHVVMVVVVVDVVIVVVVVDVVRVVIVRAK